MNRDEAKKMAEEWFNEKVNERPNEPWGDVDVIESFLACYDAMTKGEPDGYVPMFWSLDGSKCGHSYIPSGGEFYLAVQKNKSKDSDIPVKLIKVEGIDNDQAKE